MICLEGCGAGILLMLRCLWPRISPYHTDLYHRPLPINVVFGSITIDLVIVCLLCILALWLLERFDANGETVLWAVAAIILVIKAAGFAAWLAFWSGYSATFIGALTVMMFACIVVFPLLWLWARSWYGKKAVPVFRGFLAALGVCILWVLPQMVYMAIRPEPHDVQKFARNVSPAHAPQRRIVWILFDELSQDQVFNHRQPGISLPQLDEFRSHSVVFSDMQPAGYATEDVVPSLLWGKVVNGIRSDLAGNLSVKTANRWQRFPVDQSLFADAQRVGWSTGAAGWYNPYCRTYGASLDWCAWVMRFGFFDNYEPQKSLWWNVNAPLISDESSLLGRKDIAPSDALMHANDYTDLMRWSHELINDDKIGFVFLHLPLPHPLGFYDRKTGRLGVEGGSYLDNLVLTDRSLGQLMQWIGETRLASNTTVIVCSDHSWRVNLWRTRMTQEDVEASGGRFDTRPVLMVHFPGETTPEEVSQPFPAIKEHDMIESLLHGPMTEGELKAWAAKQ